MPESGLALGGMRLMVPPSQQDEALALLASVPLPETRMTLGRALLFAVLVWWCGAAPMMSGLCGGPRSPGPRLLPDQIDRQIYFISR